MAQKLALTENLEIITSVIRSTRDNSDKFAETLRHNQIPHISFSQITTVEFCPHRYYLQYVALVEPSPVPDYFTKGKLLHQLIADSYTNVAKQQPINTQRYWKQIESKFSGDNKNHLVNAVNLHLENVWLDSQVIAIEQPFVMAINENLPPCVGVIDLILQKDGHFIVIDHKTGRDFYPQDELQMAIYIEYIKRQYGEHPFEFYYEQYRWVNSLKRLRKPPFQRTSITISHSYWNYALLRISSACQSIQRIRSTRFGEKNGECFRCPYRNQC